MLKVQKSPYRITFYVWLVTCIVHSGLGMYLYLTSPEPYDVYDKTFKFQLFVFLVYGLPIWLAILGIAQLIVYWVVSIRAYVRHRRGAA